MPGALRRGGRRADPAQSVDDRRRWRSRSSSRPPAMPPRGACCRGRASKLLLVGGDAGGAAICRACAGRASDERCGASSSALGPATVGSGRDVQIALFADTIIASFLADRRAVRALLCRPSQPAPDRRDRHRGRHRAAARNGAAASPAATSGRAPRAEPRDRADVAAVDPVRRRLPAGARTDHARAVRARRLHRSRCRGRRRDAAAYAIGLLPFVLIRSVTVDVPRARRHRDAGEGAALSRSPSMSRSRSC